MQEAGLCRQPDPFWVNNNLILSKLMNVWKIFVLEEIVKDDQIDYSGEKGLGCWGLRPPKCISACMSVYKCVESEDTIHRDSTGMWHDNTQPKLIQRESRVQSPK